MLSWCDLNQTTTTPTTTSWVDVEQSNDDDWSNRSRTADQFTSPGSPFNTQNNQSYQNSFGLHATISGGIQLAETFTLCTDPFSRLGNDDASHPPKSAGKNCEINKEEKYSCDDDDDDDIFASWEKKYGNLRHPHVNTNNQRYQYGSSCCATSSPESLQSSETHPPCRSPVFQTSVCEVGKQPKSTDKDSKLHQLEKQLSLFDDDDDDDDDDILASWKKKNENSQHRVGNNGWHSGAGNSWLGGGDRQDWIRERDMSVNMATEHYDNSSTTSSISASGIGDDGDTEDVSTSNRSRKRNGIFLYLTFRNHYCLLPNHSETNKRDTCPFCFT